MERECTDEILEFSKEERENPSRFQNPSADSGFGKNESSRSVILLAESEIKMIFFDIQEVGQL